MFKSLTPCLHLPISSPVRLTYLFTSLDGRGTFEVKHIRYKGAGHAGVKRGVGVGQWHDAAEMSNAFIVDASYRTRTVVELASVVEPDTPRSSPSRTTGVQIRCYWRTWHSMVSRDHFLFLFLFSAFRCL